MGLPNLRKIIVPDPGYTMFDIDLSSADLRIVVWESDCKEMKQLFAAGLDPYTEIAKEFYNDKSITKSDPRRQTFKSFAHGTNYLGKARNLALRLGLSTMEAERTQAWYFKRFPEIKAWQERLTDSLIRTKRITNAFGYHRIFFDRIEGNVFNEAAAWIPQSTVAIVINHGYVNIDKNLPDVNVLLQVHDSLSGEFPTSKPHLKQDIITQCLIPIPYPDPLIIPVGIKTSEISWGDCG